MNEESLVVTLEAGDYSAVQQTGFVIEKDGGFLINGFTGEFGSIEYAIFETNELKLNRLAKHCKGKVRAAKRLLVDFYQLV